MLKKSLLAAAAVLVVYSDAAFASSEADEIAALKQKERAAQAQISALQAKIKKLEAEKAADQKVAADLAAARAQVTELPATAQPAQFLPTWTGFYFGAGVSRSQTKIDQGTATQYADNGAGTSTTDLLPLEKNIFNNGGHLLAGLRAQSGKWISGLEGDYTFNDRVSIGSAGLWGPEGASCGVAFTGNFICSTVTPFGQFETLGHVRGVLGYEFSPRTMGYITAGLAIGRASGIGAHSGFAWASSPSAPIFASVNSTSPEKYLFGYSVGFGIETKTSENVSARFEYIRDQYAGVQTTGSVLTGTLNGDNLLTTVPAGKAKIVHEAIRAALIYRIDGDGSLGQNRDWWRRFTTDPGLTDGSWSGAYFGGGLSQQNYTVKDRQGLTTISINDNTQPGVEYSNQFHSSLSDANNGLHAIIGYRAQWNRFVGGVEVSAELDALKNFFTGNKSPGQFGGVNTSPNMNCYEQFLPNIVCIGQAMQGRISVTAKRHVRLTGGILVTPDVLAFGAVGYAWGRSPESIGASSAGFVWDGVGAPLVGAATVTRSGIQANLKGFTFGGGLEVRASDFLSFRGEYMYEQFNWNHAPIGGAGFGGTIGDITVNSFIAAGSRHRITNEMYRFSAIVKLGNLPKALPGE